MDGQRLPSLIRYKADLALLARSPERFAIYTGYLVHNLEFCVWAAMYVGGGPSDCTGLPPSLVPLDGTGWPPS